MLRSALNLASICLLSLALIATALMLAFFASPEAVRTSPPASYNSLLLDRLLSQ